MSPPPKQPKKVENEGGTERNEQRTPVPAPKFTPQGWSRGEDESPGDYIARLSSFKIQGERKHDFIERLLEAGVGKTAIRQTVGGNAANTLMLINSIEQEMNNE